MDVNAELRLVALVDRFRKYHVALVLAELPQVQTSLGGPTPQRGLALLNEHKTGQVYRVRFDSVRCDRAEAFEMLRQAQGNSLEEERGKAALRLEPEARKARA